MQHIHIWFLYYDSVSYKQWTNKQSILVFHINNQDKSCNNNFSFVMLVSFILIFYIWALERHECEIIHEQTIISTYYKIL